MADGTEPRGLHRRMEARERRLARLEAAMLAMQDAFASASTGEGGAEAARTLAHTQEDYDETLLGLRELQAGARRLRDWGISAADTASWAGVCRALGVEAGGGAHRWVRGAEPVLHVLLHRLALPAYCSIDVTHYQQFADGRVPAEGDAPGAYSLHGHVPSRYNALE